MVLESNDYQLWQGAPRPYIVASDDDARKQSQVRLHQL